MRPAKTATELAAHKLKRASEERTRGGRYGSQVAEIHAAPFVQAAAELLALPSAGDVGPGGEIVRTHSLPDDFVTAVAPRNEGARLVVRNTLAEGATRIAEDASVSRTDLLMQQSFNALAMGIDAAESIGAENSLEKMLAHQIAASHRSAMKLVGEMNRQADYLANGNRSASMCRPAPRRAL